MQYNNTSCCGTAFKIQQCSLYTPGTMTKQLGVKYYARIKEEEYMRDYDLNPILESSIQGACVCSELLRENGDNID